MPRKAGNHGIVIPRDREMLHRLYWTEQKTLPEIAAIFDVNHKSILGVFRELGIPTRRKGQKPLRGCKACDAPVFRIKHAGNGAMYGRLCKQHWNEHRAMLAKMAGRTPKGRDRKKRTYDRWYYQGPLNPNGEQQWLSKGRAILRTAKRFLAKKESPTASQSQKGGSEPEPTSHT